MKAWRLAIGLLVATLTLAGIERSAAAACTHTAPVFVNNINHTFPAGSKWIFGIYRAVCEGLLITGAQYQPVGGLSRAVLGSGRLSQVHVPYATGTPRFLDVTEGWGLGSPSNPTIARPLSAKECAGGTRYDGNRVCVQIHTEGYGWKYWDEFREKTTIVVFMSSQIGEYNYINRWEFHDDGTIEVKLGLTGQLQFPEGVKTGDGYKPYGGRLNPESQNPPIVGIAHWHNAYYRLDFDISGSSNDRVDRVRWIPSTAQSPDGSCTTTGKCGTIEFSPITTETSQTWSSTAATSWFIYDKSVLNADGRSFGYWLNPHIQAIHRGMTGFGGGEPWSGSELWVTAFNACELFAVQNQSPSLPPGCTNPAPVTHVNAMVNGGSVDGQDIVVWYRNSMLHVPRDEDDSPMPIEWMGFEIKPRSFHTTNPTPNPTPP